jgi:hypothetical protein
VGGDSPEKGVDPDKVVAVGSEMGKIKTGSIEDVSAVGNRDIGGRGLGNWYSTDTEIKMGKTYADEIEKSSKFINDQVLVEYVNRIGQNIVKNSDCKVPFTIKVIDSDEINAFALPGGFFYVNSGLILNADEEAELAGVMAHETAHVCRLRPSRGARNDPLELRAVGHHSADLHRRLDRLWNLRGCFNRHSHYVHEVFPRVRGPGRLPGCAIHVPCRLRPAGFHHLL